MNRHIHYTLWTNHSCINRMNTVLANNYTAKAVKKVCLISYAIHIVQEDRSSSNSKNAIPNIDCYCICKLCK